MSRLSEKVAIVTGASKDIGAGIAAALGAEGARVVVNYSSDREGAERVAQVITDSGGQAIAVGADVSKAADVARLFKEVGQAEAFLLNPQPITARTAYEWGVVAEVVPNGKALSRARELAELYLKAPEVTRRNTRVHFIQPLKERIVREVGYGLSLEGASAADLVKSMPKVNLSLRKKKSLKEHCPAGRIPA